MPAHNAVFNAVQKLVIEAPVLAYYNPEHELTIQQKASQKGLGVTLMQDGHPIAYVSCGMIDTVS